MIGITKQPARRPFPPALARIVFSLCVTLLCVFLIWLLVASSNPLGTLTLEHRVGLKLPPSVRDLRVVWYGGLGGGDGFARFTIDPADLPALAQSADLNGWQGDPLVDAKPQLRKTALHNFQAQPVWTRPALAWWTPDRARRFQYTGRDREFAKRDTFGAEHSSWLVDTTDPQRYTVYIRFAEI